MYAGYEQELRDMMRNPTGLLAPSWSPTYLGLRLLSILFWFVISLVLTAALPGAVSRGVARLQLTSLRVAAIGFLGAIVVGMGVEACLFLLPTPFSALVGMLTILFIVLAGVFGRVVIYAATGRWLQRRYLPVGKNSESMALLLGTVVWGFLSSLPYVWPFIIAVHAGAQSRTGADGWTRQHLEKSASSLTSPNSKSPKNLHKIVVFASKIVFPEARIFYEQG